MEGKNQVVISGRIALKLDVALKYLKNAKKGHNLPDSKLLFFSKIISLKIQFLKNSYSICRYLFSCHFFFCGILHDFSKMSDIFSVPKEVQNSGWPSGYSNTATSLAR